MTPWLDDGDVRLMHGDALEQLALMPSESVQCIVTSPPFWGLRDYGTGSWSGGDPDCDHLKTTHRRDQPERPKGWDGAFRNTGEPVPVAFGPECGKCGATRVDQQIGLEETPDAWCARLVAVFREARRVLRNDGVCWIEVGDTYARGRSGRDDAGLTTMGRDAGWTATSPRERSDRPAPDGYKEKDLVGAPWLLAFALRADGWYLRSDTIWARPNPMPESVTDRPTKAHSYVFLLTKSARYFYDADAIREDAEYGRRDGGMRSKKYENNHAFNNHDASVKSGTVSGGDPSAGRNARSVWSIPTEPTPFAHFATFPQALVERCIRAGTSEHGACGECGAPWRRITERGELTAAENSRFDASTFTADAQKSGGDGDGLAVGKAAALARSGYVPNHYRPATTTGWEAPWCVCHSEWLNDVKRVDPGPQRVPCVVLDPFMGSGTTALVARRLGRHAIGIELNAEYLRIAAERLQQPTLWSTPT